jgi:hypothetical protein
MRRSKRETVQVEMAGKIMSDELAAMGVEGTPVNLRKKVARGKFMASFLLRAIGVETLRLEEI